MRILGLDVGSKTIGVALSDPMGWTAQGLKTLRRRGDATDLAEVKKMVKEHGVERIVVGLPLRTDGTEGEEASRVRSFAAAVGKEISDIPILFWDERFSTVSAERVLLEADVSRGKRKKVINQLAASFILQGYLDAERGRGGGRGGGRGA